MNSLYNTNRIDSHEYRLKTGNDIQSKINNFTKKVEWLYNHLGSRRKEYWGSGAKVKSKQDI